MIDFKNIAHYKENNRIEAKLSLGGLPHSIWETYSAFANTLGGIILLGVEEGCDKSFHPVDLPNPDGLIEKFWELVNDRRMTSVNILSPRDLTVETVDGKRIVAIRVPRAQRRDRPVYVYGNMCYRRNGEGDYKCSTDEIMAMQRDASVKTQDMCLLCGVGMSDLNRESVQNYRQKLCGWSVDESQGDAELLVSVGGADVGDDNKVHLTEGGLMMFGCRDAIRNQYPRFHMEYRELDESGNTSMEISAPQDCENIFDFYFTVSERLSAGEDELVSKSLREALTNCILNADYHGDGGIYVIRSADKIIFSNPGGFRIDVETAKLGGVSDSRNGALVRMFNRIGVGEGRGSGLSTIFKVWKRNGWEAPFIEESFEPERITLSLPLVSGSNQPRCKNYVSDMETVAQAQAVTEYLTENIRAALPEICVLLGVEPSTARQLLHYMEHKEIIVYDGNLYKLKA